MRLYHYIGPRWGIEAIKNARIKITRLDECNDPFELWGCWQRDPILRKQISNWKTTMSTRYGLLCFSKTWQSPLMWSHYADRHRGLCLGFDVNEANVQKVDYAEDRIKLPKKISEEKMNSLLFTKYSGWAYEKEWRSWARLEEKDDDHFFADFGENITLREVFVGPLSTVSRKEVVSALREKDQKAFVVKTRLAFLSFKVVENRDFRERDWVPTKKGE